MSTKLALDNGYSENIAMDDVIALRRDKGGRVWHKLGRDTSF